MKDIKNNIWIPKVGQGIFVLETNEWFIIKSVLTVGSWAFYSPESGDKPEDVIGVEVLSKGGLNLRYKLDEVRPETFCEYIKRPTGIGRTSWPQAIFNLIIIIFGQIISVMTWKDYGWIGSLILFIVLFGWGYSTWRNFKNVNQ